SSGFVPDPPAGKFQNNEKGLYVSGTLRADYQRAAEEVAERVARDPVLLARFGGAEDGAAFLRELGQRLFRRPLTPGEEARYQALLSAGKDFFDSGDAFADGAQAVLEAMLQSPHFLYRLELTPAGERLSGYELATKLSFLLRNTTPDDALLEAAASGALDTDEGVAALAEKMLDEPAAASVLERFHAELFGVTRYKSILKSTTLFPTYTEDLNETLIAADLLFFRRMFEGGFGLREILTSPIASVDPATPPFYALTQPSPAHPARVPRLQRDPARPRSHPPGRRHQQPSAVRAGLTPRRRDPTAARLRARADEPRARHGPHGGGGLRKLSQHHHQPARFRPGGLRRDGAGARYRQRQARRHERGVQLPRREEVLRRHRRPGGAAQREPTGPRLLHRQPRGVRPGA